MNIDNPQKSLSVRIIALTFLCLCMAACTHGPEERRAVIEQVVRPGDSYTAYALVQSEVFRKPTGINTFPNGGVNWILSQKVKVYEVHARDRNVRLLTELPADDATWQSFSGHITGFDDQNNLYLQLSGCEKRGECYPELHNYRYFHLNAEGTLEPLSELPPNAGLPGIMLARRQGEVNYVRFSISRDTLKAKFQEDGGYESLFITDKKKISLPIPYNNTTNSQTGHLTLLKRKMSCRQPSPFLASLTFHTYGYPLDIFIFI